MATSAREPRRHHYVPRLLLNRFAVERRRGKFQIHVFDKWNGSTFKTAVENVTVESDFNALEKDGIRLSLEAGMGEIESRAAPHLAAIDEAGSLAVLTPEGRAALCTFAALQFMRGADFRARFAQVAEATREKVKAIMGDRPVPHEFATPADEQAIKAVAFGLILKSLDTFAALFASKTLMFFESPPGHPFLIGDSPVALTNQRTFGA